MMNSLNSLVLFLLVLACLLMFVMYRSQQKSTHLLRTSEPSMHIVCSHYDENLDWVLQVLANHLCVTKVIIYDCGVTNQVDHLRTHPKVRVLPKDKLTTLYHYYFKYIYDYYEDLPEYVFFCHSHDTSWHQKLSLYTIVTMLIALYGRFEYVNVSDKVYRDWYTPQKRMNMLEKVNIVLDEHREFFFEYFPATRREGVAVGTPLRVMDLNAGECCVHRNRILQSPKHVWKHLMDITKFEKHHELYDYGIEGLLHVCFGEPAIRPYIEKHLKSHLCESTLHNPHRRTLNELELKYYEAFGDSVNYGLK